MKLNTLNEQLQLYVIQTLSAQVDQLLQSHCGGNWEGTLFS